MLETMTDLARQMAEDSPGRKTIVGLGAGWLFDTPIPPATGGRDLRAEWTAAMRAMGFANVVLYAIDPGGIGTSPLRRLRRVRAAHRRALVRQHERRRRRRRIASCARRAATTCWSVADPPVGRKFESAQARSEVRAGKA